MATTVAELEVVVGADVSDAEAGLRRVDGAVSRAGRATAVVGTAMAAAGAAGAAGLFHAVNAAIDFDAAMNGVAAVIGGQANPAFQDLSDLALQIGQDTVFGATEGAQAIEELAKAGVSVDDILGGAASAAANLAAATGTEVPEAANIMANALNVFGLTGADAADAADILTGAANASSASMTDLAAGLRVLGPVTSGFGVDMTDTATAIALFTNYGLTGADAGVSLARGIENLADPTSDAANLMAQLGISAFDAQGNFIGFPELFDQLQGAMAGMTDEQRTQALSMIFGAEAADVMAIAVREGGDAFRELRGQVEPSGQASESAAARMAGASGAMEQLRGSLETASIVLGRVFLPYVQQAAEFVRGLVDRFTELSPSTQRLIGLFLAIGSGILVVGGAIAGLVGAFGFAVSGFGAIATVIGVLLSPIGLLIAAIGILAYAFYADWGGIRTWTVTAIQTIWPYLQMFGAWFVATIVPALVAFGQAAYAVFVGTILPAITAFVATVWPYLLQFGNWFLFTAVPAIYAFAAAVVGFITGTVVPALVSFWETVGPPLVAFGDWLLFTAIPAVSGFVSAIVDGVANVIATVSAIWDAVSPSLTAFADWFVTGAGYVTGFKDDVVGAFSGLLTSIQTTAGDITAAVSGIASGITGAFVGLYDAFYGFGADILQGLIDGINSLLGSLQSAVGSVTGTISQVGDWIMPGSPSKRTLGWARSYVEGFTSAIGAGIPRIESAVGGVTAALTPAMPAAPALAPAGAGAGRTINLDMSGMVVQGTSDPQQTADLVVQRVYQSLERLLAGGAVG